MSTEIKLDVATTICAAKNAPIDAAYLPTHEAMGALTSSPERTGGSRPENCVWNVVFNESEGILATLAYHKVNQCASQMLTQVENDY